METSGEIQKTTSNDDSKIEQTAIRLARTPHFTDADFQNAELMKYEKANKLALGYYGMARNSKKLMTAGLVLAWNVNKIEMITDDEIENGLWVSAPIAHVGKLMGYEVEIGKMKKNRYVYQAINEAIDGALEAKVKIVDEKTMSIDEFVIIDRIIYNPDDTGRCYFHINGGTCKYVINNAGDFTVYSLILNNYLDKNGTAVAADLYEVLKTQLFKAEKSPDGETKIYMDYVDLRARLNLINVNDPRVDDMLRDKKYANYDKDDEVAYQRILELEKFDDNIDKIHQGSKLKVSSYNNYKHFRERVLVPTQEAFMNCYRNYPDLMPFMFDFAPKKYRGKVIGILFRVYTIEAFKRKLAQEGQQLSIFELPFADGGIDSRKEIAETYESSANTYKATREEVEKIIDSDQKRKSDEARQSKSQKKKEGRDPALEAREPFLKTLSAISEYFEECDGDFDYQDLFSLAMAGTSKDVKEKHALMMASASRITNRVGWLLKALKEDWREPKGKEAKSKEAKGKDSRDKTTKSIELSDKESVPGESKGNGRKDAKKGAFSDFRQNDYDFDELEKKLLANWSNTDKKK